MMVTSCVAARCSATTRQWLSEPPAISAPKRWMTHASFIAQPDSPPRRTRGTRRTSLDVSGLSLSVLCVHRVGELAMRFRLAPVAPAKVGILDRQVLDAREQHRVDALLAPEILLAVLEQPAGHRQQHAPLHEQDEPADHPAVRGEPQMRLQLPLDVTVQQFREQQRIGVAFVDGAAEDGADALEDRFVLVLGGATPLDDVPPQTVAHVALDVVHQRFGADGGHCRFAVNVPSPRPTISTFPFIASLLSIVPAYLKLSIVPCASTLNVKAMSCPFTVPVRSASPSCPLYLPVSFSPSCAKVMVGVPEPA